jgi:ABC-type transporter Mla MlaB component
MLKITFNETPAEESWILYGRLAAPSVRELRTTWKKNHRNDKRGACIVDLNEVTFIDKSGMRLLRMLAREGAQFTANGIYTKHIIEQLNERRKSGLSNLFGHQEQIPGRCAQFRGLKGEAIVRSLAPGKSCSPEKCNRVTDAPETTRRLSDHISLQPSSVPIQTRQ